MFTDRVNDPRAFHEFLGTKLSNEGETLTLDDCLGLWDAENQSDAERVETVQALREALDDVEAGDTGQPVPEVVDELRRKYQLPARP